jgi:hypothetical protein
MRNGSYRRKVAETMEVGESTLAMRAPAPLVQLAQLSSDGRRAQGSRAQLSSEGRRAQGSRGAAAASAAPDRAINPCQVDARVSSRNRELASTLCGDVLPCSYVGKTVDDGSCYPLSSPPLFFSLLLLARFFLIISVCT